MQVVDMGDYLHVSLENDDIRTLKEGIKELKNPNVYYEYHPVREVIRLVEWMISEVG